MLVISVSRHQHWIRPKYYPRARWKMYLVRDSDAGKVVHGPTTLEGCQKYITRSLTAELNLGAK